MKKYIVKEIPHKTATAALDCAMDAAFCGQELKIVCARCGKTCRNTQRGDRCLHFDADLAKEFYDRTR